MGHSTPASIPVIGLLGSARLKSLRMEKLESSSLKNENFLQCISVTLRPVLECLGNELLYELWWVEIPQDLAEIGPIMC